MATKTTTEEAQSAEINTNSATRTVKCRVVVNKLELPHGVAARGKVVHLPEDVYNVHATGGKVTFIDYVRS